MHFKKQITYKYYINIEWEPVEFREFEVSCRGICVFSVLDVLWISCVYIVPDYEVFDGQLELLRVLGRSHKPGQE